MDSRSGVGRGTSSKQPILMGRNLEYNCYVYPIFCLRLVFGQFWRRSYEHTKILCNLCLHFVRQDGQDGKKRKENHETKMTKIPKNQKTKIWDECIARKNCLVHPILVLVFGIWYFGHFSCVIYFSFFSILPILPYKM